MGASETIGSSTGARAVSASAFKDVIGRFASGVAVITSRLGGQDYGLTASAVTSLSADPPMLLICVNRSSTTHGAIHASGQFAVNVLSDQQAELARHFARSAGSKFDGVGYTVGHSGVPLIIGALAVLECRVDKIVTGGTHTVFLGKVVHLHSAEGLPLAYYRGVFGSFAG